MSQDAPTPNAQNTQNSAPRSARGSGDEGRDDISGIPVQAGTGPTWWTRLFQLCACVSLILRCRFGVFGGGWFASAVAGGVGGSVAGRGMLPFDSDFDVNAGQPGEHGGGKFGGEAEQRGGAALRGAQSELA